jgi:serine/threonine-protein kinase
LNNTGDRAAAFAQYREAIRLREAIPLMPHYAPASHNVGLALFDRDVLAAAIAEHHEAIHLKPGPAEVHTKLGLALQKKGDHGAAIAQYREAIRLEPNLAEARVFLGGMLVRRDRYAEALEELRRGHELGSKRPGWSAPSAEWVRQCERLVAVDARLRAILKGADKPKDATEGIAFAQYCFWRGLHAAAARFWIDSFAADPRLAADRQARHSYAAACSAALAGCGRTGDDPAPDEDTRARLRKQALDWLKAELVAWSKVIDAGTPVERETVQNLLARWRHDNALAGIRDTEALAKLPDAERHDWHALWAQVDALCDQPAGSNTRGQTSARPPKP